MALGDLSSVVGELEYDAADSQDYRPAIEVRAGIFAVAYTRTGQNGCLKTFSVSLDGTALVLLDTLDFEIGQCWRPSLCLVTTGMVAVSYMDQNSKGSIKTLAVAANGDISEPANNFLRFTESFGDSSSIVNCGFNNIFALACKDSGYDGYLHTLPIETNGDVTGGIIQTYEFDTGHGEWHSLVKVTGNIFVNFYSGPGFVGLVKSFTINNDGTIDTPYLHTFEVDSDAKFAKQVVVVATDVLAFFYSTVGLVGKIRTLSIDGSGQFAAITGGTFTLPDSQAWQLSACHVASTVYAFSYIGPDDDGWVKTILIQDDGQVAADTQDLLEFDDSLCTGCNIVKPTGDIVLITYNGPAADGWARTVGLDTAPAGRPHHEMVMGIGQ